ncbi:MAG: hypothetical protein R3C26_15365 [Calditrichia bacterium]
MNTGFFLKIPIYRSFFPPQKLALQSQLRKPALRLFPSMSGAHSFGCAGCYHHRSARNGFSSNFFRRPEHESIRHIFATIRAFQLGLRLGVAFAFQEFYRTLFGNRAGCQSLTLVVAASLPAFQCSGTGKIISAVVANVGKLGWEAIQRPVFRADPAFVCI